MSPPPPTKTPPASVMMFESMVQANKPATRNGRYSLEFLLRRPEPTLPMTITKISSVSDDQNGPRVVRRYLRLISSQPSRPHTFHLSAPPTMSSAALMVRGFRPDFD